LTKLSGVDLMSKKICFIVGHGKGANGGYDPGACAGGCEEFQIAKMIGKYAQEYYNKNYSETADLMNYNGNLYLQERINKLKDNTYDFIAEIHLNAGGGTGTECYYYHGSRKGQKYADKICDYISADLGIAQRASYGDDKVFDVDKDGGDKTKLGKNGKDYFGIIRDTKPCAVLVETVFIDTASDLAKVKTAAGQKKCGEAIAKAVAEVRGLKKKATTASTSSVAVAKPATTNASTNKNQYYKRYTGNSGSIVDALKAINVDSSFSYRKKIAKANGISAYLGTPTQNTKLLVKLKAGTLIKPQGDKLLVKNKKP
jgi:N-acetylmuramoyl-L-alanine amidase